MVESFADLKTRILRKRPVCEICGVRGATELHHCLVHDSRKYHHLVTVEENLYVEPGELFTEEPQAVPDGMVSVKVPGRGYALGKAARVLITVPQSAALGTTGEIVVSAEASWLGQGGSATVKQARDFDFTVTVVSASTEYTETIVGEKGGAGDASSGGVKWWPAIIGAAILIPIIGWRRKRKMK